MTHPSNGKQNPDHGLRLPAMSPLSVRVNIQIVIALLSDLQNAFWLFGYLAIWLFVAPTCKGNVYKKKGTREKFMWHVSFIHPTHCWHKFVNNIEGH